jgi:membrane-associated phospholipid phosphatase
MGSGAKGFPSFGAPSLSDFATTRHLAYAVVGGLATWYAWENENADAMASSLNRAPLELGGDAGNVYGQGAILAAGTAALWTTGHFVGSPNMTSAAHDLATGLVIDGALVFAVKTGVDRTRPNGGQWSFPSGHTSSAFTVAPILWSHFGWKVGAPAYALAVSTGLGRIEDHWHFPSDVIAGATMGLIVGEAVATHHQRTSGAGLIPGYVYMGRKGLGLQFRW